MKTLQGKWNYRSFCPRAGAANSDATIAAPWAPPAVLTADTDASGKITGTLQFAPTVKLAVKGSITSAGENLPEGIDPSKLTMKATLYYQSIPPYYLMQRFEQAPNAPATQRLLYLTSRLDTTGTPIENWKLLLASSPAVVPSP